MDIDAKILQEQLQEQRKQNRELLKQNQQLLSLIASLQEQIAEQTSDGKASKLLIEKMHHQIEQLQRTLFGKKSERLKTDKQESQDKSLSTQNKRNTNTNAKGNRSVLKQASSLDREEILHELAESDRSCKSCGARLNTIGEEITEQLEYKPASLYVKKHVRPKYACSCGDGGVKIAPLPAQPIDKGLPGPGLLSAITLNKYQDALPLYRQMQIFNRHHVQIPSSTMCDWIASVAFLLEPIVLTMKQELLTATYINSDDTTIPVLQAKKTHTGRLWVYLAEGSTSQACTVYEYTKSRSQSAPIKFLEGYKGYLQADAYVGYDPLFKTGDIIEVGCLAHARRKFFEISKAVEGESLADEALSFITKLYNVERHCKDYNENSRYYYRKRHAKPILKRYKSWLLHHRDRTLPKVPINKAINYSLNHWIALQRYLASGNLMIDNNSAERAIKPLVIGRKNYMFAGSHAGASRAAIIYSIIETCKQNQVNTWEYLTWVLAKIPEHPNSKIKELLPYNYKKE